ncbi:peptidoglycan bridge formation glycyltransferase FemA/FemB family protein [Patescibacteria group bacterium]|nr:peptidoglycan bridge formation glycyltransferase FemA/FemB family protein [Patescibacteria group bacterium]
MKVEEISEKEIWENFFLGCEEKTFLDSWNWGEFQRKMGNSTVVQKDKSGKIWRLGIYKESDLIAVALIIKISARRGTFVFCPHAPALAKTLTNNHSLKHEVLKTLLKELKKIAKEENASFVRISPIWKNSKENIEIFKNLSFRTAPIHMHPELTWELDIVPPEEELLIKMRKTTRYLIKQAQKNKDIEITKSTKIEDVERFNELYQKTVSRHHFIPFSIDYLTNEVLAFLPDNQVMIFLGKYKNPRRSAPQNLDSSGIKEEIVSAAIIIFWQGIAFYHQGASSPKYPKIPVSYLLQWEAIKEAKKRGCNVYNFWGIAPSENKKLHRNPFGILRGKHPWAGLTLFKTGFGGYKKEYVRTQDLPLSSKYWLNFMVELVRRSKRGL